MSKESSILIEAQEFAEHILLNQLSPDIKYHTIHHTYEVVKAVLEISRHSGLSKEEHEIVELAAWFHDLGYRDTVENHEKVSANLALDFLTEKKYNDIRTARVAGCIMATQMPQSPKNELEAILCDADMMHLANKDYFERTALLHNEIQQLKGLEISDADWMESNRNFIDKHQFFTDYARERYAGKKRENLDELIDKLKKVRGASGGD